MNLGTPDAPTPTSVKTYLQEFLSDRRVIDLPRLQWLPILHGIILRTRPKKSAKLYQSIWTSVGSPLLINSQLQHIELQKKLQSDTVQVRLAMNYGNPSVARELEELHDWGMKKLIVVPLFPQYSSTTTASIWDNVVKSLSTWRDIPEIIFIRDYPDHPKFIRFLAKGINEYIHQNGNPDAIILSYHGIPERYAKTGDDYPLRCQKTTDALKKIVDHETIITSFQSKFGSEPWIEPSTSDTLQSLARHGKKHVIILAPSFTADCLETLEELEVENKELFLNAGGEKYQYLSAVNDDPLFIEALEEIIQPYLASNELN